jgi:hypothetical protein
LHNLTITAALVDAVAPGIDDDRGDDARNLKAFVAPTTRAVSV